MADEDCEGQCGLKRSEMNWCRFVPDRDLSSFRRQVMAAIAHRKYHIGPGTTRPMLLSRQQTAIKGLPEQAITIPS